MGTPSVEFTRRTFLAGSTLIAGIGAFPALAGETPRIAPQPYFASVERALATLAKGGQPITETDAKALAALASKSDIEAVAAALYAGAG